MSLFRIIDFCDPVSLPQPDVVFLNQEETLCDILDIYTPNFEPSNLKKYDIAIIGIPDGRDTINENTSLAPNVIRNKLYQLAKIKTKKKIVDLGNLKIYPDIKENHLAFRELLIELFSYNIIVIVIGGAQHYTYSINLAYQYFEKPFSFITVDAKLDVDEKNKSSINSDNYLSKILKDDLKKQRILNYCNFGHQQYFVSSQGINYLTRNGYSSIRLGELTMDLFQCEPLIRNADFISIDSCAISAVYSSANRRSSPNGLTGEEICQISRFAGMSDNIRCYGYFEHNTDFDNQYQSAHLAAQNIWYFIDGITHRNYEDLSADYIQKFIVHINNEKNIDLVFLKSNITNRWWIEIILPDKNLFYTACSFNDYQLACNNEIPHIWWHFFDKFQL
jgi:formiminoglutamase